MARDADPIDVDGAPTRDDGSRRREPPPTMRDIATLAGVSQSTVSRVLNDVATRVPITEDTRTRVNEAARRLGYRPNPLARGLRGAPTMLLGAVVRDITDPFFAGAIEALSEAA
jgi:DNA-binding LacI/PurR family transcriptional regulator